MPTFVIAAYRCEVAGRPTDSRDFQVRYFESDDVDVITARLRQETPASYQNIDGESVRWIFEGLIADEVDPRFEDGAEIIGFITDIPKHVAE